jgi:hypothetical protein
MRDWGLGIRDKRRMARRRLIFPMEPKHGGMSRKKDWEIGGLIQRRLGEFSFPPRGTIAIFSIHSNLANIRTSLRRGRNRY